MGARASERRNAGPETARNAMTDLRLALYEPDIAPNVGALLRTAACLGATLDLIEPAGFVLADARMRRAGLDYAARAALMRHASWAAFQAWRAIAGRRVVLLTTRADLPHHRFAFRRDDIVLLGSESAGVPEAVHHATDARIRVPMRTGMRSLNVAMAAAIVLGEALRQTESWPIEEGEHGCAGESTT